ncbi:insulin-like growth factor II [Prorops nasuta]|uniref:insulin-like growth factor II n=1 Tax=Prorops nasuta TaxID=863751 RepID=UPI0034D0027C
MFSSVFPWLITSRRVRRGGTMTMLRILVVLAIVELTAARPYRISHQRTLRLCSRSLSDALYLACRGRGYNEPFSYSGEEEQRGPAGPGLVEECCYHSCSYAQLQQYCKPSSEDAQASSRDVMEETFQMANVANTSASRGELSSEERSRSGVNEIDEMKKCKAPGIQRSRKRAGHDNIDHRVGKKSSGDRRKEDRARASNCQRRRRPRRRRFGKNQRKMTSPELPPSKMSTATLDATA